MKKAYCILVFFLLAFTSSRVSGQAVFTFSSLTVDKDTFDCLVDSALNYSMVLVNTGNQPFSGNITFYAKYNTQSTSTFWESFFIDTVNPIQPGDTFFATHQDPLPMIQAQYVGGDNIMLVWPYSPDGAQTPDTSQVGVYVKNLNSVEKPNPVGERVDIYPNPVQGTLKFNWKKDEHKLEYVRLFSTSGQEVFMSRQAILEINVEALPAGMYILEIQYEDGFRGYYRVSME